MRWQLQLPQSQTFPDPPARAGPPPVKAVLRAQMPLRPQRPEHAVPCVLGQVPPAEGAGFLAAAASPAWRAAVRRGSAAAAEPGLLPRSLSPPHCCPVPGRCRGRAGLGGPRKRPRGRRGHRGPVRAGAGQAGAPRAGASGCLSSRSLRDRGRSSSWIYFLKKEVNFHAVKST